MTRPDTNLLSRSTMFLRTQAPVAASACVRCARGLTTARRQSAHAHVADVERSAPGRWARVVHRAHPTPPRRPDTAHSEEHYPAHYRTASSQPASVTSQKRTRRLCWRTCGSASSNSRRVVVVSPCARAISAWSVCKMARARSGPASGSNASASSNRARAAWMTEGVRDGGREM